jgi:Chemotaxis protein histidine kinase and related kinases
MLNQEEFLKQLREAFAIESKEHIQTIASALLALEQTHGEPDQELIETTYRAAHSLKGAARAVDLKDIEYICHSMESVFQALKRDEIRPESQLIDTLHEALHLIELELSNSAVPATEIGAICERLDQQAKKGNAILSTSLAPPSPTQASVAPPSPVPPSASTYKPETRPAIPSTIRVQAERLDTLLRESENLIAIKQLHAQIQAQLKSVLSLLSEASSGNQARKDSIHALSAISNRLASESVHISTIIDTLIEEAQSVLMLPCSVLFDSFPLAAYDIAKSLGKEVSLDISGQTIELEKRILEKLKDPLMHILRNAIDHGIEPPGEREAHGKPRRGHISISVSHLDARHIEIIISDDGQGIDPESIRSTAVARRMFSESEAQKKTARGAVWPSVRVRLFHKPDYHRPFWPRAWPCYCKKCHGRARGFRAHQIRAWKGNIIPSGHSLYQGLIQREFRPGQRADLCHTFFRARAGTAHFPRRHHSRWKRQCNRISG